MNARRVEPGRGWAWIVQGWQLFTRSPWVWIGMILIYFAINLVLSFIPILGFLASTLIGPALMGGMIYGAASLDQGRNLEIPHLFRAFQDRERLGSMLTLGAILLLVYIIAGVLIGFFVAGGMMGGPMMEPQGGPGMQGMPGIGPLGFVVIVLVILAIASLLFYSVPLVMLEGMVPFQAVRESVSAFMSNILPLLVFFVIYALLAFLAALPFGLGFLILGPVTFGAVYVSYRDVFGRQAVEEQIA